MIIMKSGSTLVNGEIKTRASGAFSADAEVEKRLVDAGVAEYAAFEPVATPRNPPDNPKPGSDIAGDKNGSEDENNGSEDEGGGDSEENGIPPSAVLTPPFDKGGEAEELMKLTLKELKTIAEQKGVDSAELKTKAEFVDAIIAAEAAFDDGEDEEENSESSESAPALSVKEPVI